MGNYFQLKVKSAELLTGNSPVSTCSGTENTSQAKIFSMIKDESVTDQSKILNYQSLSDNIINPIVDNLVLPLSGKLKYEKGPYNANWIEFETVCSQLNSNLNGKSFLLGDNVSTADTTLAAALKPAFENLLGETERNKFSNITAWYESVSN